MAARAGAPSRATPGLPQARAHRGECGSEVRWHGRRPIGRFERLRPGRPVRGRADEQMAQSVPWRARDAQRAPAV